MAYSKNRNQNLPNYQLQSSSLLRRLTTLMRRLILGEGKKLTLEEMQRIEAKFARDRLSPKKIALDQARVYNNWFRFNT